MTGVSDQPCGNPFCMFLAHRNPELYNCVGFCCQKCEGRTKGEAWAKGGKAHYKHCEGRTAALVGEEVRGQKRAVSSLQDSALPASKQAFQIPRLEAGPSNGDVINLQDAACPSSWSAEPSQPDLEYEYQKLLQALNMAAAESLRSTASSGAAG
eukprot:gnl/TRDRNA2_/TRDRNA2_159240_c0_seq2.p1 gnl/TRDRNA2_/TRDRNA2_159240_c0~~gnl/TRDRNA2_/TRDRNA2_159240_c0_seq2.p1  ORF type:complete len:154 (+),score=11.19 gnl/TRDRNA2_/TRDRNA2_159240_c0_seq2:136-597(+)